MLFSGLAEVLSLGAVLPFLTLISNPQSLTTNYIFKSGRGNWPNNHKQFSISYMRNVCTTSTIC